MVNGWINYYGIYNRHLLSKLFVKLDYRLLRWYMKTHKWHNKKRAVRWLEKLKETDRRLFAHWKLGYAMG